MSAPKLFVEVGQRFGRGVVIDPEVRLLAGSHRRGARLICDCGTGYTSPIVALTRDQTKSCGCLRRSHIDRTGQRFGKLIAVRATGERGHSRSALWICRCDCGNEKVVSAQDLVRGLVISCGCARRQPKPHKGYPGKPARNQLFSSYRGSAKKRNHAWELTGEQFDELTSADCFYCGSPPSLVRKPQATYEGGEIIYNGIDRVDNALGYIPENVVTCCKICNLAKRDMSFEEFTAWARRLAERWVHSAGVVV